MAFYSATGYPNIYSIRITQTVFDQKIIEIVADADTVSEFPEQIIDRSGEIRGRPPEILIGIRQLVENFDHEIEQTSTAPRRFLHTFSEKIPDVLIEGQNEFYQ